MGEVTALNTKEDFDKFLTDAGDKLVVIDFFAVWCGPCKVIAPKIKEFAAEYQGSVLFGKVDVDENEEVVEQYGISSMPTFYAFKNGKKVGECIGADSNKVKTLISQHK